jgi:hypothetical protein
MKNISLFLSILGLLLSCTNSNECEDVTLTIDHLDCENSKYSLSIDLMNDYTIIRSEEGYNSLVKGICHPGIDFSKYDLIIGTQSSGNENDTIIYDLRRTCPEMQLTLNIEVIQSALTRPDFVTYHALIPKLGDEETVIVNINSH